jgi:hypothetical protein
VRSFCLDYGAFNDHMVDLAIIVSSFILEIGIGASGDGVDYAMGKEIVALLRRLIDLEWRWWGQIGLYFVLAG